MPSFKPVGVDADSLFPTRVMNALKQLFLQSSDVAEVATSGDYSDLIGTPTIPSSAAAVHAEPEGLSTDTKTSLKATYVTLAQLAANPDQLAVGAITRSATGAATTFGVNWPDGSTGTFVGTESTAFPGAIDAYTLTKIKSGTTVTFTQPALTRDSTGSVTNRPAITAA